MAFSSVSSTGKATYFENLMNAKAVSQPLFGFHLTRKQATGSTVSTLSHTTPDPAHFIQLCIGCYDSSKFTSNINWVPVVSQTYWSVSMTGFSANGRQNALKDSIIGVSTHMHD